MTQQIHAVVIGAGQAGLAVSYYLTQHERSHIILEKHRIGEAWRSGKWDSFTLVTPNWTLKLPGFHYDGNDPAGYATRDEVVQYLERYARSFDAPVRTGVEVTGVRSTPDGFLIETSADTYIAQNVVVATGAFQQPRIPPFAPRISPHIQQIHSSQYRNPDELPAGAVLVVGSGQSGCQITEELYHHGRKVYLSTSNVPRIQRHYRGREIFEWLQLLGFFDQTVDQLDSPADRFKPNPQLTGKDGGHALNLHQFALDGVTLLGHMQDAYQTSVIFKNDLMDHLATADKADDELRKAIDEYIQSNDLQAPPADDLPELTNGYEHNIIPELNLDARGIKSIIWATGYQFDFSWIEFPLFDQYGYPVHHRGVTNQPGLYFIGLLWQHTPRSSLFYGMGEDAAHIVEHLVKREYAR